MTSLICRHAGPMANASWRSETQCTEAEMLSARRNDRLEVSSTPTVILRRHSSPPLGRGDIRGLWPTFIAMGTLQAHAVSRATDGSVTIRNAVSWRGAAKQSLRMRGVDSGWWIRRGTACCTVSGQGKPCPYSLVSHRELGESSGEGDEGD